MKYLLVCAGEVNEYKFLEQQIKNYKPDFIIAVDKGANYLEKIGIKANLLIGDFDSIDKTIVSSYNNIIKLNPIKDDTDTAHSLDYAIKNGASEIMILCGIGSRFDHSYANMLLMKRCLDKNILCSVVNEKNQLFMKNESFNIKNKKNHTVSFFALDEDMDITLKGFFYPLNSYHLTKYDPLTVSNIITSNTASVDFNNGTLLVDLSRD